MKVSIGLGESERHRNVGQNNMKLLPYLRIFEFVNLMNPFVWMFSKNHHYTHLLHDVQEFISFFFTFKVLGSSMYSPVRNF